ncbi:MAG: carboxylesterase family protein, partial [Lachnospiraceae bacterium]|nr:carboxylesterase family protein [Lachnospiraceae bacterium]
HDADSPSDQTHLTASPSQDFAADTRHTGGKTSVPSREEAIQDGENMLGPGSGEEYLASIHYDDDPEIAAEMYRKFVRMTGGTLAADLAWCQNQNEKGKRPCYQYYLTLVPPGATSAHHSAEHHYVFQTLTKSSRPYTGRDWDLSNQLASYWANFIKTGDPNGEGLPEWTPNTAESPQAMDIDYDLHMIDVPVNDFVALLVRHNRKQR